MLFQVISIFPEMFDSFLKTSLIARGIKKKLIEIQIINLRDFATDKHKSVDDRPYGGGPGMVMRVDVVDAAVSSFQFLVSKKIRKILLEPSGRLFTQKDAKRLSKYDQIVLIAGHYEGVDDRVRGLVDEVISIGDYVLTGGELPAMVLIDAISRHVLGFLGKKESLKEESFENNLLEYPQYTRPEVYKGIQVPKVLLTGDHSAIGKWRLQQAIQRTKKSPRLKINYSLDGARSLVQRRLVRWVAQVGMENEAR